MEDFEVGPGVELLQHPPAKRSAACAALTRRDVFDGPIAESARPNCRSSAFYSPGMGLCRLLTNCCSQLCTADTGVQHSQHAAILSASYPLHNLRTLQQRARNSCC